MEVNKTKSKPTLLLKFISRLYLIICTILLVLYFARNILDSSSMSPWVTLSFAPNGILSIFYLILSFKNGIITLYSIHWYFVAVFFFFVPLLQYLSNSFIYEINPKLIALGNIFILIWCIFYIFSYNRVYRLNKITKVYFSFLRVKSLKNINIKLFFMLILSILTAVMMVWIGGFDAFYTRASYNTFVLKLGGWGPLSLIVRNYLQPLVFSIFVIFFGLLIYTKVKKTYLSLLSFVIIILILPITNNPLMFPRFYAFAILFGMVIIILQRFKKQNSYIYMTILFIGLPLSSIVDQFRRVTKVSIADMHLNINLEFLFIGHFDAYENFIHSIRYVSENGIVFGQQLVGALLFFVPRNIWLDKPVGSGNLIAHYLEKYFQVLNYNVGFPLVAEMFINFHLIGIIFGALFYGFVSGSLDKQYISLVSKHISRPINKNIYNDGFDFNILLYPFLIGLFLFHLRGDFMSSIAYTVGFIFAFFTAVALIRVNFK